MALIHVHDAIRVGRLKKDFLRETGLGLSVLADSEEAGDRAEVSTLVRGKRGNHRKLVRHLTNMNDVYCIPGNARIGRITEDFYELYGLTIAVIGPDGRAPADDVSLRDAQPEDFEKPVVNVAKLRALNDTLRGIERDIHEQWERNIAMMLERLRDTERWLTDFEMEVILVFALGDDDPLFRENSDNTIVEEHLLLSKDKWCEYGIDDNDDHADGRRFPGNKPIRQCYLFHSLHDRIIELTDMQRIGQVHMDYRVITQRCYRVG